MCVVVSVVWVHQACIIIPFDGRTMAGLIMRLHKILLPRENRNDFFSLPIHGIKKVFSFYVYLSQTEHLAGGQGVFFFNTKERKSSHKVYLCVDAVNTGC